MLWFSKRPSRPASGLRTRLSLESLDGRFVPSSPGDFGEPPIESITATAAIPTAINDFGAEEFGHGWFLFTGTVAAGTPGGLTVTIVLPSGATATGVTFDDGTFAVAVNVQTNGGDDGTVSATVVDGNGQSSPPAYFHISPTP